jgi:hypothetical protein
MPREQFSLQGPFKKLESSPRRIIAGYANMAIIDHVGDLITVEAWEKASARFMASGYENVNIQHGNITVGRVIPEYPDSEGKLWKTHVDENGWFVVCEIRSDLMIADLAWDLIEKHKLREFSISGTVVPGATQIVCEAGEGCHRRIDDLEMYEVTLCEEGINPGSAFMVVKSKGCCKDCASTLCFKQADLAAVSQSRLHRLDSNVDETETLENQSIGEKKMPKDDQKPPTEKKADPPAAPPPAAAPPSTPPTQEKQADPNAAAIVEKLDAILQLLQKLVAAEGSEDADGEDESDTGGAESSGPGMNASAKAEPPAAPPATPPSMAELVAAEVKAQLDAVAKQTPSLQKRSKVPGAGSPAGPDNTPVIELVKKANDEAGWNGVEALAEQLRLKALGSQ